MLVHRIQLREPWDVVALEGRTRHERKFGRPRTQNPAEQIWLVCGSLPVGTEVTLNGERIGVAESGPLASDVSQQLLPRNSLVLDSPSAEPIGAVALEIRAPGNPDITGTAPDPVP